MATLTSNAPGYAVDSTSGLALTPAQNLMALIGRVLIALLFIPAGWGKIGGFAGTAGYIASKGLPMPEVLAAGPASVTVPETVLSPERLRRPVLPEPIDTASAIFPRRSPCVSVLTARRRRRPERR